ncbi:MAG TPA: YetF domain-containing protein [Dehalococcoidia bacterium]|nr:YetF domain-containing protein [Dehalococcoidia bacterium]
MLNGIGAMWLNLSPAGVVARGMTDPLALASASQMFQEQYPLLELFFRTSLIYVGLLAVLRVFGRREAGSLEMADLLMIVLIADGVQNGMSGNYNTVTGAAVVGGTIIGWNWFLAFATFRVEWLRRLMQPGPLLVIKDGQLVRKNMRSELITRDEIFSLLRAQEVDDLGDVEAAYLEGNGQLSVRTRDSQRHKSQAQPRSGAP